MKTRLNKRNISYIYDNNSETDEDEYHISIKKGVLDYEIKKIRKIDKEAYNNFLEIKMEINNSEPNLLKILKEPLLKQDRVLILQLYDIYKKSEPSTEIWLDLKNKIKIMFENSKNNYNKHCQYSEKQHSNMKKQIAILNKYQENHTDLEYKILQLETSLENKKIIYNRYKEFKSMNSNDDEKTKLINWLNYVINIPHDKIKKFSFSTDKLTQFLQHVSQTLDQELYGMKTVKEQILLFTSLKIQNPHIKNSSIGLLGLPGVGKTHIARLLANALNFPFQQISLGGISNPEYLKGYQYTYIGSQPGEIVKCLERMKYKNGILFLDEFDKISNNHDICSALLHITDPIQNSDFRDNFLIDITIDLSYLWFIYSMNSLPKDQALKDRIHIIEVPGYSIQDKVSIIKNYLLPKALKNINIDTNSILISDKMCISLIKKVCNSDDLGIRTIEKAVQNIVTKIDFIVKHQNKKGKLNGFNMSFDIGKFIKYPLNLNLQLIEKLT